MPKRKPKETHRLCTYCDTVKPVAEFYKREPIESCKQCFYDFCDEDRERQLRQAEESQR